MKRLLMFISLLCVFVSAFLVRAEQTVSINMRSDIIELKNTIFAEQPVETITDFSHPKCLRDVVEFVLGQQALLLGGSQLKFQFPASFSRTRNLKLVELGLSLLSFDTVWLSRAALHQDSLYISEPVIRNGEFFAGVFTAKSNLDRFKIETLNDLKQMSFISNNDWHIDWLTLQAIAPKKLIHEAEWYVMAKLVSRGWVDGMLATFTNQTPFKFEGQSYAVYAIPGIKILLPDSRHFVVSKKHPLGKETFQALQVGLKQLREQGRIVKAYQECGFLNPRIKNWKTLNVDLHKRT